MSVFTGSVQLPGGLFCPIGNPLSDGTWTYTWEKGRQLKQLQSVDTTASFIYNENGLRVQKTVNGVVTDYTLHGKNIVHMTQGSNSLHFFYDASNKPAIVEFNGTKYAYVHNLQGDIVAILDSNGTAVVQYKYDAWGKPISKTGSMKDSLGKLNPFRYRGYVYDEETELYYLQSRYYDIRIARFINRDSNLFASNSVYSYGDNNPICTVDPQGQDAIWITSSERVPIWGHTALLIEYRDKWYYCKFAQNGKQIKRVPDYAMSSLDAFNRYLKVTKSPYDSCTYIFGDFTESYEYYDALPSNYHKKYSIITNNCMTMSWKLLSMGTAADGSSIEDVMRDALWASDGVYGRCDTCIPNLMVQNVKYTFANDQFTAAEAKDQIMRQYAAVKKQQDSWIGRLLPSQVYSRFKRLIGDE